MVSHSNLINFVATTPTRPLFVLPNLCLSKNLSIYTKRSISLPAVSVNLLVNYGATSQRSFSLWPLGYSGHKASFLKTLIDQRLLKDPPPCRVSSNCYITVTEKRINGLLIYEEGFRS